MAFSSGSFYVGQQWLSSSRASSMELFSSSRRNTANEVNGKRRQDFDCNTADADGADVIQSEVCGPLNKKQCNGICSFYKSETHLLDQGNNWEKDASESAVSVAMETDNHVVVQVPQNKPRNVCSRCLAGEPGHIKHIVDFH